MLPFQSLAAVTSPGPGTEWDLGDVGSYFTLQWVANSISTGNPSGNWAITVNLEGSLDSVTWDLLESSNANGYGSGPAQGFVTQAPGGSLVRYVRANLSFPGVVYQGTPYSASATVDSWLASSLPPVP